MCKNTTSTDPCLSLHPDDDDILDEGDSPAETRPRQSAADDLLNTPSPIREEVEALNRAKKTPATSQSSTKDRIRVDISVSLRRHGQKIDPTKVPKTCITQFSVHRKPLAYRQADFYTTAVDQARIELFKAPPFSSFLAFQGPWMPTIEFVKPAFKLPNTKDTCVFIKAHPTERQLMLLTHAHTFGNEKTEPHQKLYIIFDLVIKSKFQLEKVKTEIPEAISNTVATDSEYNLASRTLLENAEKVIPMLDENVAQAETEWYNALIVYKDQRQINPDNLVQIQPRPYQPALTVQDHAPALVHCTEVQHLVNNRGQVKPNLQIQIRAAGGREVFHTPDTTGTPLATPTETPTEMSQPIAIPLQVEPIGQGQPPTIQPQIIGLTPEMLRSLMQQAQPAPVQVPMHLRLGPKTPPLET